MGDASDPDVVSAQATLQQARDVADRLRPDLSYWFGELYYYITQEEIEQRSNFQAGTFVLHFIPFFYDLYATAAELHAQSRDDEIAAHWQPHFAASTPVDQQDIRGYVTNAIMCTVLGIRAHISGDMATALVQAYRSYLKTYMIDEGDMPLDDFKEDFFTLNRPVFEQVRRSFVNEFQTYAVRLPAGMMMRPQDNLDTLLALADIFDEQFHIGLSVDSIYGLRETAWQTAKQTLEQS
jgi:hypothetical protein